MLDIKNVLVIIPCYNEESFISEMLSSLVAQTFTGALKIIVVDDHSTDSSYTNAQLFKSRLAGLEVIKSSSKERAHKPGSKVIHAFYDGLKHADATYDIICKFDADIILPANYLEKIVEEFYKKPNAGMVSGHLYIQKSALWVYENVAAKNASRGPIKAYRAACFKQIGGLKHAIGWDTIDELLARYHGWAVITIPELHVKHLKPTGASYNTNSRYLQGEALYTMRYGWLLTLITAIKIAWNKKNVAIFLNYLKGFYDAKKRNLDPQVTVDQGRFIRNYRWNGIKSKLGF